MCNGRRVGLIILSSFMALPVWGCGGRKVIPVQGIVAFRDGTPMSGGWVVFEPVNPEVQVSAIGDIQSNGTFVLNTDGKADGAMEGWYRVIIQPPSTNNPNENIPAPNIIHPNFQNVATTPLRVEVKNDGKSNHITLHVERP